MVVWSSPSPLVLKLFIVSGTECLQIECSVLEQAVCPSGNVVNICQEQPPAETTRAQPEEALLHLTWGDLLPTHHIVPLHRAGGAKAVCRRCLGTVNRTLPLSCMCGKEVEGKVVGIYSHLILSGKKMVFQKHAWNSALFQEVKRCVIFLVGTCTHTSNPRPPADTAVKKIDLVPSAEFHSSCSCDGGTKLNTSGISKEIGTVRLKHVW